MKVAVEGRLHYTKWTDNAGVERYGVEIYADKVDFLTKAFAAEAPAEPAPAIVDMEYPAWPSETGCSMISRKPGFAAGSR